jgi:hypothetical protein
VIAQDVVEVIVVAREDGFNKRMLRSREGVIELASLGVSLPVVEIYHRSGF